MTGGEALTNTNEGSIPIHTNVSELTISTNQSESDHINQSNHFTRRERIESGIFSTPASPFTNPDFDLISWDYTHDGLNHTNKSSEF